MATNYKSTVGQIAEEVAGLLRHDNIDARVYAWIGMAYADVLQRLPLDYFQEFLQEAVAATAATDELTTDENVGTPMACVMQATTGSLLYLPTWVTPAEYSRITITDSVEGDSTIPRVWTIMKNSSDNDAVFIYPPSSGGHAVYLFHIPPGLSAVPATADYLPMIPYHFEDVIIWGAAMFGAQIIRSAATQVYVAEYEEALQDLGMILSYHPDSTPVHRSIDGAYEGTPRMRNMAQFPQTIS
jgi:hypothetical protein